MAVIKITSENFETEVLKADKPVIVDFWADWCGPCKRLSPAIEQLSNETTEVKMCKVNIDEQPELANQFHVMSIPMLVAFKDGKVCNSSVGVIPKNEVLNLIR